MKNHIKSVAIMVCICSVMALLLAITNHVTAPTIEKNEKEAVNKALSKVMPNGVGFEAVDISELTLDNAVQEVYKDANGGYVIKLKTSGYGTNMIIMCGINADSTISGAVCLSSNETLGYEKTYGDKFTGQSPDGVEKIDVISGATKTTAAYKNAIKTALDTVEILKGEGGAQ